MKSNTSHLGLNKNQLLESVSLATMVAVEVHITSILDLYMNSKIFLSLMTLHLLQDQRLWPFASIMDAQLLRKLGIR